MIRSY